MPLPRTLPRLWPGERCFILGGGPSLPVAALDSLRAQRTIAVNNAYKVAMWADAMFFGDCRWYKHHGAGLVDFAGLKVTTCVTWEREPGIRFLHKELMPYGISEDPTKLRWNYSSGACAMNLAAHLGVSEIVLLGFDMHRGSDGSYNFHRDYVETPPSLGRNPYPRFLLPFPTIKADLDRLGIRVVNATPGSALDLWPVVDPAEVGLRIAQSGAKGGQGEQTEPILNPIAGLSGRSPGAPADGPEGISGNVPRATSEATLC